MRTTSQIKVDSYTGSEHNATHLVHFVDVRSTLHEKRHGADVPTIRGKMKSGESELVSNHKKTYTGKQESG
jgi:hypothetical protein